VHDNDIADEGVANTDVDDGSLAAGTGRGA